MIVNVKFELQSLSIQIEHILIIVPTLQYRIVLGTRGRRNKRKYENLHVRNLSTTDSRCERKMENTMSILV